MVRPCGAWLVISKVEKGAVRLPKILLFLVRMLRRGVTFAQRRTISRVLSHTEPLRAKRVRVATRVVTACTVSSSYSSLFAAPCTCAQ